MMMMMIMMMIHDKLKERYDEGMVCHTNVTEQKHKMMMVIMKVAMMMMILR